MLIAPDEIEKALFDELREKGSEATLAPQDLAIKLAGKHPDQWGPLMPPIRRAVVRLAEQGKMIIYRKGNPVDPSDFRGIYRIGLPRDD